MIDPANKKSKPNRVLIFGSSGFIGRRLLAQLSSRSNFAISGFSSQSCDLTNRENVRRVLGSCDPDMAVVVCSCISRVKDNSFVAFQKNVSIANNVCEEFISSNATSLVFLSSTDIYGIPPVDLPITEDLTQNPGDNYGLAKFVSEKILERVRVKGKKLSILRLPGVYGYGDHCQSVIGKFINKLKRDDEIMISGDGCSKRDYVYIADVCNLIERLVLSPKDIILNIATGDSMRIKDIAELISRLVKSKSTIKYTGIGLERDSDLIFDNGELMQAMPGMKITRIAEGVEKYLSDLNIDI